MLVFMLIEVKKGEEETIGNKLLEFKEVKNAHVVEGEWNLVIRVKTNNIESLQRFIYQKMRPIKGILRTETFITTPKEI